MSVVGGIQFSAIQSPSENSPTWGKLHGGEDVEVQHGLFLKRAREGIDHLSFHYLNYISTPPRYSLYPKKTRQYVVYDVATCNFKY